MNDGRVFGSKGFESIIVKKRSFFKRDKEFWIFETAGEEKMKDINFKYLLKSRQGKM